MGQNFSKNTKENVENDVKQAEDQEKNNYDIIFQKISLSLYG